MICIYPKLKKDNKYMENYVNAAKTSNDIILFSELLKKPWYFFKIKIFHFNWIENVYFSKKLIFVEYLLKILFLSMLRILNKKIVWTFHNKLPHEPVKLSVLFNKFMIKISNRILIHSKESSLILKEMNCNEKKIYYIPHGNYIGNYGKKGGVSKGFFAENQQKITLMFVGQIRKYKNIEILIKGFESSQISEIANLLIVGKCQESYFKELKKLIKGNNIKIINKFIEDEEFVDYLDISDALILPYDLRSSLNSASVILAFSYHKTVIAPKIGTLKDMEKENFYYAYEYDVEDKSDHEKKIIESLNRLKKEYDTDNCILKKKGDKAFKYIKKYYSWDKLTGEISELYNFKKDGFQ